MSVPAFEFGPEITGTYQDNIDTIILVLGKDCLVVCDGEKQVCPNCIFDSVDQSSTGVYNGTGPRPFTRGKCPVCGGTGFDPTTAERTFIKRYSISRNLKQSEIVALELTRPSTAVRIKGFVADLEPLRAMKYVVLDYKNQTAMQERYEKASEPEYSGSIVPGRYFKMYLKRVS